MRSMLWLRAPTILANARRSTPLPAVHLSSTVARAMLGIMMVTIDLAFLLALHAAAPSG